MLKKCAKGLLFVLLFLLTLQGCSLPFVPDEETPQSEAEDSSLPKLPEVLKGEEGQEPVLKVYIAEEDLLTEMPFEEYIAGVVAAEMDPSWDQTALAAQAIIARTFTLQKIAENGGVPERNAHASTDIEEFQAYDATRINENVRAAVEATRGEVATYQNQFIRAWFHAYAGPKTAFADEGLDFEEGNPPYIQSVSSPGERIIPEEERGWSQSFDLQAVQEAVQEITGKDPGTITTVEIAEKGPSGRVTVFKVNDLEVSAPALRLALGSTEMRSTFVEELKIEDGKLLMSGTGYGHGVGMCQWGARALAEEGRSPEGIVDYFYRDIELVMIWS